MDKGLIFMIFIAVLAIVSAIFLLFISRKYAKDKSDIVIKTLFFFSGYCFILSMVKLYLGDVEDTLIESLWDSGVKTYIHYGVPLFIIGLIASLIGSTILKKYIHKIMEVFDIYLTLGMLLVIFIKGRIENLTYCILFMVCLVLTLITICMYKKDFKYIDKKEYVSVLLESVPYIALMFYMNGVFLPNELFLNNINEFSCPFFDFFFILVICVTVMMLVFMLISVHILPVWGYKIIKLMIAGIGIMGYVQTMFLNGKLNAMDGSEQIWTNYTLIINSIIWLAAVGIIVVVGYKRKKIEKIIKIICIYLLLVQTVSVGVLVLTTDRENANNEAMTTTNSLELGAENNVIVFVLDRFDSAWMDQLIEKDSDFVSPLSDFTYYTNATSYFAHTGTAIPYMLTGVECKDEKILSESYKEYAYSNSDFLHELKDNDYDVGIYTAISYLPENVEEIASNYSKSVEVECDVINTLQIMMKSSMYKTVPFTLKPAYTYYSGDVYQIVKNDEVWNIDNDIPFYNNLVKERLSVTNEYKNTFRFYHMRGPHYPFYLSEDIKYDKSGREVSLYTQIKGSLNIVYEYLNQLKMIGKYDDSTIIITADHGQQIDFISDKNIPQDVSTPIMLVKEANKKCEKIKIDTTPVSQGEIIPTISKAMGLEWEKYGKTFDEIGNVERERMYIDVYKDYQINYTINGDVKEISNWSGIQVK